MSRRFATVAGSISAAIAVLFVVFEFEMRTGGAHVSELTRVGMAVLAVVGGGIYFNQRIVERALADDQAARPAPDEPHIARVVVAELVPHIKAAVDAAYRSGMVAGAERATRTNGRDSGGFPKLAHIGPRNGD